MTDSDEADVAWMMDIKSVPPSSARAFGVYGERHSSCPYSRAWESRCVWTSPLPTPPPLPPPLPSDRRAHRLLIIGDSIDSQLFSATACLLHAHGVGIEFRAEWQNSVAALKKRCGDRRLLDFSFTDRCHYTSASLRVSGPLAGRLPFDELHLCQDDRRICIERLQFNPSHDVVLMGSDALHRSAYGVQGMFVRGVMNGTLARIHAQWDVSEALALVPSARLIWRETTAQHFSGKGGHWGAGFMMSSNIERLSSRCTEHGMHHMRAHSHWNAAVDSFLSGHSSVRVLRVWNVSAQAWWAHVDAADCTHYCVPGIPTTWAGALLEAASASR